MANENDIELIRNLRKKLAERDAKHIDVIRKATNEISSLKKQLSIATSKNDNGQLVSVVARLQGKILSLQDDLKDISKMVSFLSKKEDPKEEEKIPHVEVDKVGDTTYVGKAEPDSSFDKPVWCIQRIKKDGNKTKVEVAESECWSKRKEVTYA